MKRYLTMLAILALLGALAAQVATASAASTAGRTSTVAAFDLHPVAIEDDEDEGEDFEVGDDESEFEECEVEDFGIEWDDEGEEEELTAAEEEELEEECGDAEQKKDRKDAPFVSAPAACHVSRAESKVTALPATDQVRLTVRYRTWAPTPATVDLKLRDRKGAVAIEHTTQHLGGRGVLHLTVDLGDSIMERALKASEFDVSLLAPRSPGYCADALEQQLRSAKHTGADSPRVYSD